MLGRRSLAVIAALFAAAVVASPSAGDKVGDTRSPLARADAPAPNIVVIMVDDMRDDDLQYMPWTRKLVGAAGVRFVNSLSPSALCCPARASVLTGLTMHNHGVLDVFPPWAFPSFDDSSTLATWLQDAGYATIYVGKYLNGYGLLPEPGEESGSSVRYVPPGWTRWLGSIDGGLPRDHPAFGGTYSYWDTTLSRNGDGFLAYQGEYQSHVYGELTERIIKQRAPSAQPFFLYVSYTAPHVGLPVEADDPPEHVRSDGTKVNMWTPARPKSVWGRFDERIVAAPGASWADPDFSDKPAHLQAPPLTASEKAAVLESTRQRVESLWIVDQQVRRTIQALVDAGALRDTYVLFTSDNGYFLGEQRRMQGKALPHGPAMRVPLLLRGPGIPRGQLRSDPITSIDIAPTLAKLAGVTPGLVVDGASLAGVARTGDLGWRRGVLTESRPFGKIDRGTDLAGGPLDPGEEVDRRFVIGVRTARYLYTEIATGERELYDLAEDPREYTNLVGDPAYDAVQQELSAVLAQLRDCDGAECRVPLPQSLTVASDDIR